jgi:hypothetical protein
MPPTRLTLDDIAASPRLAARFRSPALELLDGREHRHPLPSAAQVAAVVRLASAFDRDAYGLRVGVRERVAAPPYDLLRPDVALLRPGAPRCGAAATPAALVALAVLAVERVDDALERLLRYAAAGIVEAWVLAVEEGVGAAYAAPSAGRYRRRSLLLPGEPCAPETLPWARVVPLARASASTAVMPQPSSSTGAPAESVSSAISKVSPPTSMTSPGTTRRLRRVSD